MTVKKVGYGSPPDYTKWEKGQSGNPKGRPKGSTNLKTDLIAELSEVVQVNEGGKSRKLTKQRAFVKTLMARSLKGDARAANIVLSMMTRMLVQEPEPATNTPLAAEDQAIVDAFLNDFKSKDNSK